MVKRLTLAVLGLAVLTLTATEARATSLTGGFAIGSTFRWTDLSGAAGVPLASATSIDFAQDGTTTHSGTFLYFGGSGDFAGLGATGTIKDSSFTGQGNADFPIPPILSFEGGVNFDALAITYIDADPIGLGP